jgi:hypothetical protein
MTNSDRARESRKIPPADPAELGSSDGVQLSSANPTNQLDELNSLVHCLYQKLVARSKRCEIVADSYGEGQEVFERLLAVGRGRADAAKVLP